MPVWFFATLAETRIRASGRLILVEKEVLPRLARTFIAVVLELRGDRNRVVLLEQPAHFAQSAGAFRIATEQDVEYPLKPSLASGLNSSLGVVRYVPLAGRRWSSPSSNAIVALGELGFG